MEKVDRYIPLSSLLSFRLRPASWLGGRTFRQLLYLGDGKQRHLIPKPQLRHAVVGTLHLRGSRWPLAEPVRRAGGGAGAGSGRGSCRWSLSNPQTG